MGASLSARIGFIVALCILCLMALAAGQVLIEQRLVQLQRDNNEILKLSTELLQLRRHEKDFMLRYDQVYQQKFNQRAAEFLLRYEKVSEDLVAHGVTLNDISTVDDDFIVYTQTFNELVDSYKRTGLTSDKGLKQHIENAYQSLLSQITSAQLSSLLPLIYQVKVAEQAYLLGNKPDNYVLIQRATDSLSDQLVKVRPTISGNLKKALQSYQLYLDELHQQRMRLGFTHETGLQIRFRSASHAVEDNLRNMSELLEPRLQEQIERLQTVRTSLVAGVSLLLLFALLRLFYGVNREVKSLISFFNKSHTQYADIDLNAFKLVEFQSLALRAHYMMRKRKQADEQRQNALDEVQLLNHQLSELADKDTLTGLANRRSFERHLHSQFAIARQHDHSIGLLMIDIDHFKLYNDHYGHIGGDNVLIQIAKTLESVITRSNDLVARYGGEEFVVVLPDTTSDGVHMVAKRLLTAVNQAYIKHAVSPTADNVTVSIGGYEAIPAIDQPVDTWLEQADQALYESKQNGRNCITIRA